MDMGSGDNSTGMTVTMDMMVPWLHFNGGDNLFFKAWKPSSSGAIAGASIALFVFAVLDRWISAWRRTKELNWKQRALEIVLETESAASSSTGKLDIDKKSTDPPTVMAVIEEARPAHAPNARTRTSHRVIPPFIASHDIPRGIFQGVQSFFSYALMLAVMTFQAAYIISIILGLAVGEILFGRIGRTQAVA
ncbi:hypothetical protein BV22DRAFT_744067 [Leucogyrophana mollusca]|uniref:Uncharacterized protein n=1 Tax=Leucogyrophana mollusca TaxID=85980 RepID=A0ACB8B653_9AGAM|nr:hypothetical protein BV22DRAFT_744067 [Leucogyrophana mollusca]